jgi:2-oxoglutarate dehydrogenase E2 component (dihydrolipoamide succinyltransferase)
MASEVRVPTLGESIVEATIGKWLKREGDSVAVGEVLVELETDKINVEVTAEAAGVVGKLTHAEGDSVAVGDVIALIEAASAPASPAAPEAPAAPAASEAPAAPAASEPSASNGAQAEGAGARAAVSPVAKRIAEEQGVDLSKVVGTGPGGRIIKDDVVTQRGAPAPASLVSPLAPAPPAAPVVAKLAAPPTVVAADGRREERVRLSRRRQTIAQRLVEAQRTAAMLTTFNEVDMSAVMELRKRRKDAFKERHGVNLGFMSFFTKAVVGALKAFPMVNGEIQGDEVVVKHYYDIGIAVGVEEGLVVPVLRDADRKSFAQLEAEIADLATRAREGKLGIADMQGGTFTITNGGVYGSLMSTPILNTPQVGILGMHKIEERPIAKDGQVVIRPMMYVALSYDHRIIDGSTSVRFLVRIKELVEDPESLLLEG